MHSATKTCAVCGETEQPENPLCEDGLNDDAFIHLRCYNSIGAKTWRAARRAADPAYDRYWKLMTIREPIACPHCKAALEISPKAVGMGAGSWSVHCTTCHRSSPKSFLGYGETSDAYSNLERIRGDFVSSRNLEQIDARMNDLASANDHYVNQQPCQCGARFSLAAKARCLCCDRVVIDSYFHVVDEPLSKERIEQLEALFGSRS
jgi:hypothetical protein